MVDRAGRLQLPPEYAEKFQNGGLAEVELEGDTVTIRPPSRHGDTLTPSK